jgi:hypothetical protein
MTTIDTVEDIITRANNVWRELSKKLKEDPEFVNMEDMKKIQFISTIDKKFQEEFPAVSIYMIFHQQYSAAALRRVVEKMKTDQKRIKNEGLDQEDIWCQRQADYVQYLAWELSGKTSKGLEIGKKMWQPTYEKWKEEVATMKKAYQLAKENVEKQNHENRKELAREVLQRVAGDQSYQLDKTGKRYLIAKLQVALSKESKDKCMVELLQKIKRIEATTEAAGVQLSPVDGYVQIGIPKDGIVEC